MGLSLKKEDFPGYKTMQAINKKFPVVSLVKAAIGVVVPGFNAGEGEGTGLLAGLLQLPVLGPLLVGLGVIVGGLVGAWAIFRPNDIRTIYSFNWNVTDAEIKKQLEGRLNNLYSQLGSAVGSALGWLACGVLPGTLCFFFNPAVAAVILKDVTEEMAEEVWGELAGLQHGATQLLGNAVVAQSFMNTRRFLKKKDSPFYDILKDHFGDRLDKWGNDGQPSWSFQKKVEDKIETIDDPRLKNFTEEFVESLIDSCIEALQMVGRDIGTHLAANAMMQRHLAGLGSGRATVQLDFSRDEEPPATPT
jgi:hypothetical protein